MKKNVLVIGGGGREHAIVHALSKSAQVGKLYCIPGNAGIAALAECHGEIKATDIDGITAFVVAHKDIALTVVAPDDPLAMGLVDKLEAQGCRAFGPRANAAIIESSKVFSKNLMKKYGIATAAYEVFDSYEQAKAYLEKCAYPVVLKADGLALGKGVLICNDKPEAEAGLKEIMLDRAFGEAGAKIVIEEFLRGFEVSVLAFTDGKTLLPMVSSQDHKRALDGDKGLNTGGMGTFSPQEKFTPAMQKEAYEKIFLPTIRAMEKEGRTFKGVLYFGLMVTDKGIKVLEYNARFGDPETQVILPRLKTDLLEVFDACIDGTLDKITLDWDARPAVCVVAASGGYPLHYEKGKPISFGKIDDGVLVFHAGTARNDNGEIVTSGGRVLGVTALGNTLSEAKKTAYENVRKISFDGMFYRSDIGKDF
ncbi:MAG: phosphoribosylamine--glycine ligase [Clostridiales bacterium]|nr:phosphoribosylamine--glycine ligase [Clostridiales bacterium]